MKKRDNQGMDKGGNSEAALRAARQAEALRANLQRRKEQTRARRVVPGQGEEDGAGEA